MALWEVLQAAKFLGPKGMCKTPELWSLALVRLAFGVRILYFWGLF